MNLNTDELLEWQEHRRRRDALQAETKFSIEPATKDQFLQELREGSNDTVLLMAHHADGKIYFPGGVTLTNAELSDIQREIPPERSLIIISCEMGIVNARRQSPSEMMLAGQLALNVIAHPKPVSASKVPDMLREYLIDMKNINEVFTRRGYLPITENLLDRLSPAGSGLAAAVLSHPLSASLSASEGAIETLLRRAELDGFCRPKKNPVVPRPLPAAPLSV